MLDAIVVGGGPAGLSAALWLGRYRRHALLIDAAEPRSRWVHASHGYLGFDGVDPCDLRDRARSDLERYETVSVAEGYVKEVRQDGESFFVSGDVGEIETRSLVFATGVRDTYPEVANLFDHFGKSVFTCPSCDGYETKGQRVAVFGWTEEVVAFAEHLLDWAGSVVIVTDGARFEGRVPPREPIEVLEADAIELIGRPGRLEGIRFADGRELEVESAFITIDQTPCNDLAVQLGCDVNDHGCVEVNEHSMTSVELVYAAGDMLNQPQLIQVAAASGAIAGIGCAKRLAT